MFDFLIPNNPASLIMLVIVLFLLWGTIKTEQKDSILRAKRHQEEKETLGTAVEITLTHRQVQRHLETILERIASEKLTKVIITNSKEAPQGVLLSYGEYRALLFSCFDLRFIGSYEFFFKPTNWKNFTR